MGDDETMTETQDKAIHTKSVRRPSEESIEQAPKKTYVQELSLWSGLPDTNLFKMFIRYVID